MKQIVPVHSSFRHSWIQELKQYNMDSTFFPLEFWSVLLWLVSFLVKFSSNGGDVAAVCSQLMSSSFSSLN